MATQTTQRTTQTFFNLPQAAAPDTQQAYFGTPQKHTIQTNWYTFEDQPLSLQTFTDVLADRIPVVREKGFLTPDERQRMLEVVKTHNIGAYDEEFTWPRVGMSGITQYDHISDSKLYFKKVQEARSLQNRWKKEAGVDVMGRVIDRLRQTTGMKVQIAQEGDDEYFAGILRAVDRGIGVHADYAPYEAAGWKIGNVVAQVTWNILLNEIPGGDTLVYDRQWQAPDDDIAWRKEFPRDSYHPQMLQGHPFKAMEAIPGDLTFFNPRNFHEVKACDTCRTRPDAAIRFTVSSFVGFLVDDGSPEGILVLWS